MYQYVTYPLVGRTPLADAGTLDATLTRDGLFSHRSGENVKADPGTVIRATGSHNGVTIWINAAGKVSDVRPAA